MISSRFVSHRYERWRGYDANYQPERDMVHKHLQRHPHIEQLPPPSPVSRRQSRNAGQHSLHSSWAPSTWSARISRAGTAAS